MKKTIRVGSRESKLAMVQSNWVIDRIREKFPDFSFELIGIKTVGDLILDKKLDKIGGKGLFIKELETALLEGSIDIAVHSMKDMPAELPDGLMIGAVSKREDPRDVLITRNGEKLGDLKAGAVIGTSSTRREVQIKALKPDCSIKTLRGNVLTRLNKLENGEYDGILLAMAGLNRLGLGEKCRQAFEIEEMIPGVGQGALGVETRCRDDIGYLLESIHDGETALAVQAERAYMARLNGSCSTPIAAYGVITGETMKLFGMLADEDLSNVRRAMVEGNKLEAAALGEKLADLILERRK